MTQVFAAAGSKAFIGSAPIDLKSGNYVEADFSSVTWVEIDPIETIGVIGDAAQEVVFASHSNTREITLKGTRKALSLELSVGLNYGQDGQAKLVEAEASDHNYPIRLVFSDPPASGSAPTPSERLMVGLVMSTTEIIEGPNSVLMLNATIAINCKPVPIAAATGD